MALRESALRDVQNFLGAVRKLNVHNILSSMEEFELWLRLESSSPQIRQEAREDLGNRINDLKNLARYARLALDYDVEFERQTLAEYLSTQKLLGGWKSHEALAAVALAEASGNPNEIVQLLENSSAELEKWLDPRALLALDIESLARSGRIADARVKVEVFSERFGAAESSSIRNIVEEIAGGDPLALRIASFEASGSAFDRRLLADELLLRKEFKLAAEHLTALFAQAPTISEASRIARCLIDGGLAGDLEAFLARPDVTSMTNDSLDLQSYQAWSAYLSGDLRLARDRLIALRRHHKRPDDRALWVNISVESGNWEDLSEVIDEDLSRKDALTGDDLRWSVEIGRALRSPVTELLVDALAEKGKAESRPELLLAAYQASVGLGLESKTTTKEWFQKAHLMSGPDGPVQALGIKDVISITEQTAQHQRRINDLVNRGDAPLSIAAQPLHMTLVEIVIGSFIVNSSIVDPRMAIGVPLFAGNRKFGTVPGVKFCFDRSSLISLTYAGLLEKVLEALDGAYIARGAMGEFLADSARVPFHQPSRIAAGQQILDHVALHRLKPLPRSKPSSAARLKQLGRSLCNLVHAAEASESAVVISPPLYKPNSLMEELVDPTPFCKVFCDLPSLVDFLEERGVLSEDGAATAKSALGDQAQRWPFTVRLDATKPIYLDELSAARLEEMGLLSVISRVFSEVIVSSETLEDAAALVGHAANQRKIEAVIRQLRLIVANAVKSGKLRLTPANARRPRDDEPSTGLSLENLIRNTGNADAIIVDDRAINKFDHVTDESGRQTRVATSLDLLITLAQRSAISPAEVQRAISAWRNSYALFLPINREEMAAAALRAGVQGSASFEMNAIANYVDVVCMKRMLKIPEESQWLIHLTIELLSAVRIVWDSAATTEIALAASRSLMEAVPDPREWIGEDAPKDVTDWAQRAMVLKISFLANTFLMKRKEFIPAFRRWVEDEVIAPVKLADPIIVDLAVQTARDALIKHLEPRLEDTADGDIS